MRILVCDDDKEIVDAIEIYLVNEGYEVLKAYDGAQAVKYAEEQEIHLIIMDIMMPGMDGIRATMKLRESANTVSYTHLDVYKRQRFRCLG